MSKGDASEGVKLIAHCEIDFSRFITVDDLRKCLEAQPEARELSMDVSTKVGVLASLRDFLLKVVNQLVGDVAVHECSPMPSSGTGIPEDIRLGECVGGGVLSPMPDDHPATSEDRRFTLEDMADAWHAGLVIGELDGLERRALCEQLNPYGPRSES